MPSDRGDAGLHEAIWEILNEETYGWTENQHEQEIERLKGLVEFSYRAGMEYLDSKGELYVDDDEGAS